MWVYIDIYMREGERHLGLLWLLGLVPELIDVFRDGHVSIGVEAFLD